MSKISFKQRVQTVEAMKLPEDAAVQWLKDNSYTEPPSYFSDNSRDQRNLVCFIYARRKSPRLNLAIARFGSHRGTLRNLFKHGTQTERLAVLSNVFVGPKRSESIFGDESLIFNSAEAVKIITNFDKNPTEFAMLLSNPNLDRGWLSSIIAGWKEIEGVDERNFINILLILSENPIIGTRHDDTFMDGFAEHSYQQLNLSLANLLQTAPITVHWAVALQKILQKLYLPFVPDYEIDLLSRWQNPDPSPEDKDRLYDYFGDLRTAIVSKLVLRDHRSGAKESVSVSHEDKAVRMALYGSLRPHELFKNLVGFLGFSYPNFRYLDSTDITEAQKTVVDVCRECFARDGNDFIQELVLNEQFWKKREDREFLNDICWSLADDPNSSMDLPNLYRAREQYYLKNYPKYFDDDEDVDIPHEDTLEGRVERIADSIADLREKFDELSLNRLEDEQQQNFDRLIDQTERQFGAFSEELRSNAAELTERVSVSALIQNVQTLEAKIGRQQLWYWVFLSLLVYLIIK